MCCLSKDNPVNQTVIEAMLRSLGFTVSVVTDGVQAVIAKCRKSDFRSDSDGLPTADHRRLRGHRQIRQLPGCTDLPIIALTANALPGRPRSLSIGGNERLPGQALQTH